MAIRRSERKTKAVDYSQMISCFPDGPPQTDLEYIIDSLNRDRLPADSYSAVDDVIVYSLFASKTRPRSYRAWTATSSAGQIKGAGKRRVTPEEGITIANICYAEIDKVKPTVSACKQAAIRLYNRYPHLFDSNEFRIVEHLLLRYFIMYMPESPVGVTKNTFDQKNICGGLKARCNMQASSVIVSTCGTMSCDRVEPGSISIIEASPNQLGPSGLRVILGPFRFANHDCQPNCQIMPLQGTYACALITLRCIQEGEYLTVKYTGDGYYHAGDSRCRCASCNPESPPEAPRREVDLAKFMPSNAKKTRRGRRGRGKEKKEKKQKEKGVRPLN